MIATLTKYPTLTEALAANTPSANPDQDATKIIKKLAQTQPKATQAVLFVNHDFSSSKFGAWTVMAVGPNQTYKTVEDVHGSHLFDLPSQRQYPVAYVDLEVKK